MNIDKTRFLVLTGFISAATVAACSIQNTKKDEPAGTGPTTTTGDSGSNSSTTGDGSTLTTSDASTGGDAATDGDAGPACTGDDGAAPACASSKCPTECESIAARVKKGVARKIADCLELAPTCEGITQCVTDNTAATAGICDDATAATFCQPLVDSCAGNGGEEITQETCVAMAKTLTTEGRDQFTSCITEGMAGYCTYGSSWCLDALKY